MQETWVQSQGWEDPLEKEMATHSSTLAGRIPWREEPPGRLQSMGSQRVGHDWATSHSLTQKYHKQVKREGHSKRTFIKWDEHFEPSESESRWVVSDYWWPHGLYSPWNSPGQNPGVHSFSLLQGIFPTQGSNPGLPHCRQIPYQLSHQGSPRILEWVAYSFCSESFQLRNWTGVSCIAGRFFNSWTNQGLALNTWAFQVAQW